MRILEGGVLQSLVQLRLAMCCCFCVRQRRRDLLAQVRDTVARCPSKRAAIIRRLQQLDITV